jgi:predicted transcriptional regulator of viral defense system
MIRDPSLCGGIYHVLDVYAQNAERYLLLIVNEVQQHGSLIDKARAGYILDERLGLPHPIIEAWKASVQRGGSRKLSTKDPYMPVFSEKWDLSINIFEETPE